MFEKTLATISLSVSMGVTTVETPQQIPAVQKKTCVATLNALSSKENIKLCIEQIYPDPIFHGNIISDMREIEDIIQIFFDGEARDRGMELIEQLSNRPLSSEIQELQKRLASLNQKEKSRLNTLLFEHNRDHFVELYTFVLQNTSKKQKQKYPSSDYMHNI